MRIYRAFIAMLLLAFATLSATPALAAGEIAIVDFQQALNEVNEGEAARKKLEGMFEQKRSAIDQMEQQLKAMQADYEKQALILSDASRQAKEQELMQANMAYQQTYMQSEQEMQALYGQMMEALIGKMRDVCEVIGKERGYALIVEVNEGGLVYYGGATDVTAELVKRYNAANPG